MTAYIDPLDEGVNYSRFDTVVIGIKHEGAKEIGVNGFSRHNKVFDAFREPFLLLPILLDIPCFIRILDAPVYDMLEDQIVLQYCDPADTSLPPLVVIGDCKLYDHPLIFMSNEETAKSCWSIYRKYRRRAKRLAKKER